MAPFRLEPKAVGPMFQLGLKRSSESKRNNMAGCPKAKAAAAGKHQKTEPRETAAIQQRYRSSWSC
jgi:hypothetical protein